MKWILACRTLMMLLQNLLLAESQRKSHADFFKENVPYFSFLMDGTTDVSKMEDEAVVMLYCKKDDFAKEIKSYTRY